ncbi:hypothetical protein CYJ75_03325 [Kocuria rhizophila]|nr:hypothetical protein CYJ75_03325 [Kocuria rhizophila]
MQDVYRLYRQQWSEGLDLLFRFFRLLLVVRCACQCRQQWNDCSRDILHITWGKPLCDKLLLIGLRDASKLILVLNEIVDNLLQRLRTSLCVT